MQNKFLNFSSNFFGLEIGKVAKTLLFGLFLETT
jgi:hypothetical protein